MKLAILLGLTLAGLCATALADGVQVAGPAIVAEKATIDLLVPALIPDDYIPDVHVRLVMYKRVAGAESPAELAVSIVAEMILQRSQRMP